MVTLGRAPGALLPRGAVDVDPLHWVAELLRRDLSFLLDGDRVRLDLPNVPAEAVRALEEEINLRLEVNKTWAIGSKLAWSVASVLAAALVRYDHAEAEKQLSAKSAQLAPALPALLELIQLDPYAKPSAAPAGGVDPTGRADLENDLWIAAGSSWGRGALIRALLERRARQEPRMPLLEGLRLRFGRKDLFAGTAFFAVQHLLESTRGLFKQAELMGLEPSSSFLIGKRNSTEGMTQMMLEGRYNVANIGVSHGLPGDSAWTPPGQPAHQSVDQLLAAFVHKLRGAGGPMPVTPAGSYIFAQDAEPIQTAVFLDDGAEAISRVLADPKLRPEHLGVRLVGVEQTRFGARRLREAKELPFAVVNVAESPVKLLMESVLIGWSVAHEIEKVTAELELDGVPKGKMVALIGYGAVGRAVALALRRAGYAVEVIDPLDSAQQTAGGDSFPIARTAAEKRALLEKADYVVGATGKTALDPEQLRRLKQGAVLFSASSSTIEFAVGDSPGIAPRPLPSGVDPLGGAPPREDFAGRSIRLGRPATRDHWHRVIEVDDKQILLARGGYPVNLTGTRDPIAPALIQLTRGLLLLGSMQAARLPADQRGLVDLDREGQLWLAERFMDRVTKERLLPRDLMALMEDAWAETQQQLQPRR